jgi:SAM-dependent methyltransferase
MSKLSDTDLEQSSVVANSAMNRERACVGSNSYTKELPLNPVEFLKSRLHSPDRIAWLDLCCGTGRALIEAARMLLLEKAQANLCLVGVDLVAMFHNIFSDTSHSKCLCPIYPSGSLEMER